MTSGTRWSDGELARLQMEGLDFLMRLHSGEATEQDATELVSWRMQSRAHEEAFRSAVRLRKLIRVAEGVEEPLAMGFSPVPDAPVADGKVVSLHAGARRRISRRAFVGGAIAASAAGGVLFAGTQLDLVPSVSELRADYRTGTGQRRRIRLAGGASVELNTRTSLNLRHDLGMPAVELVSGEAIMASGRGEAALVAGKGTSTSSGARFNARIENGEVCITCLGGEVDVSWSNQRRRLGRNDQVRYNDADISPVVRGIDTVTLTAWQSGTLIFRNMPMRAVVAEINRYRPGRVFLVNASLADWPLNGTYYVDHLDVFFSQAELAFGVKVTRLPGNVVILA